ncbi:lipoprotein Blc [Vibrio ishigakensis]|uniref:Outer membrane lipoprotein Blc n=1 Tax=Vibrio ishigakensis TaxID=1481914 RepID=A0A0B8PIB2_9VIBR|nr:lipoprotein Blc [Vibrio ishigakensis]
MKLWISVLMTMLLTGCVGLPEKVTPINDFELERYLGKWYEVARLDHSFERGMNQVTADYSMREDGGVKVLNQGYLVEDDEWKSAEGKAYFVESEDTGYLKVSFFGPFYGSYVVFELDKQDYQYAFISGPNHDYLWFLSRTPQVSDELKQDFIAQAKSLGFDTEQIIWVDQK